MIIPDFEELFKPYTIHGATLDGTRGWLVKKGARLGIPEQIADQAIAETMLELAGGKTFFHPCPCCEHHAELHNAIEHYMRDRMISLNEQGMALAVKFLQDSLRAAMVAHIERENALFVSEHMRPGPAWRGIARLWNRFKGKVKHGKSEL